MEEKKELEKLTKIDYGYKYNDELEDDLIGEKLTDEELEYIRAPGIILPEVNEIYLGRLKKIQEENNKIGRRR